MHRLVLLIEDNEDDREIYGKLLWYNGFDVIFAVDADMGYWLAREAQPELVLLDLGLPDMDGIDLCRRLASERITASMPVVALTARSAREHAKPAFQAGCTSYLEKPISPFDVLKEVERLIGRAHYDHPARKRA